MKIKRILAAMLAAILAFSAAGCGSVNANETDTAAVAAAIDKLDACKSFTVEQITLSTEVATTEGVDYKYEGNKRVQISLITGDEFQMSTVTETEVKTEDGSVAHSTASYVVPEGQLYTEYYNDGDSWYKLSTEDASVLSGISAKLFTSSFYVDQLSFGKTGEDMLESGKALRYEAELVGAELMQMLDSIGYFVGSIGSMSENQQAKIKENLVKDLNPVTVCVWVDEASGYPVRFEVDMTGMLNDLEKSISKTLGDRESRDWAITEYEITMSVKDFNAVDEIVLPPEAASAQLYEIGESVQS